MVLISINLVTVLVVLIAVGVACGQSSYLLIYLLCIDERYLDALYVMVNFVCNGKLCIDRCFTGLDIHS